MARQGATAFGGLLNLPAKNLPNPIFAFAIRTGSAKHLTCARVGHAKPHEWRINELRVNRLLLKDPIAGRVRGPRGMGWARGRRGLANWAVLPLGTRGARIPQLS